MNSIRVLAMIAVLALAPLAPAFASFTTPSEAATALKQSLPSGSSLSMASPETVLAALSTAAAKNPEMLDQLAILVSVARPDLSEDLRQIVAEFSPSGVDAIMDKVDEASSNPAADQLAAIAEIEGAAPAAGDDEGTDGSAQ